ncbi:ABC transporter permease subunit [Oceaniserpentilla sp. 4NH20-0058]|uniref:ABC transporter permease subunit n=1 Tax=Oceaniserpentilla sp. 4NH20-0058 TaxID=3127660 RepID=UPI0031071383
MSTPTAPDIDFDTPALRRHRKARAFKDQFAKSGIAVGGLSIIGAVLLIFFYLLYEVAPMFVPADVEKRNEYVLPGSQSQSPTLLLAMEEQAEVGLRIQENGQFTFFGVTTGETIKEYRLPLQGEIKAFDINTQASRTMAFVNQDGDALIAKHNYRITYPNDVRLITPKVDFPYGDEPLSLFDTPTQVNNISMRDGEDALVLAAIDAQGELYITRFNKEVDFLSDEVVLEAEPVSLPNISGTINQVEIDQGMNWMFVLADQRLMHVVNLDSGTLEQTVTLDEVGVITSLDMLLGENSLLIGTSTGQISQWFMARKEGKWRLQQVRQFEMGEGQVNAITSEQRRKGFFVAGEDGHVAIYHSTAHRTLYNEKLVDSEIVNLTVSPRAKDLLIETQDGKISHFKVDNEHPEISWASMWDEVWYEGYEEPAYTWQSSSSSSDFEPKYSLVPLVFGTLKGAFYAMLLAAPLAIAGAVYTAYFMAPALRRKVKPIIELMEALPTVILGFLAGLALAPFIENNLLGIFIMMIVVPISMLVFGFTWVNLPAKIRHAVPDGWDSVLLIPVIILAVYVAIQFSPSLEQLFFGGSMTTWLNNDLGVSFSQRNALIVGLAMGFAVIPTIFSIAEDAIFSVPKSLSYGSLALGATPWQTMIKVVLPTASPGIFSALMIGLGRAVGETMIVLMATGNTPITDMNIFEGMRTLAANIAVEIPESEVGSSHYRILFLTGFVLFLFTFVFNTAAETIRQRLRTKYGQL